MYCLARMTLQKTL